MLIPMPNANVNEIRKKADRYLSALEHAGVQEFSSQAARNSREMKQNGLEGLLGINAIPECVEDICYDLHLNAGSRISAVGPSKIIIGHPIYGSAVSASSPIEAAKAECWKDDNRKKLRAAKTDERHLVVYIPVTNGSAWLALTELNPPDTLAELPREISDLWLISDMGDIGRATRFVVWRASTNKVWQKSNAVCA